MGTLTRAGRTRSGKLAIGGGISAVTGVVLALVFGGAGAPAASNPPGNNGTVKIDGVVFDQHPNNEPHVGCTFQVDFYGFDEGDLFADVEFAVWPPTGGMFTILEDTVFIGEDDNSGGSSEAGLDAEQTYDLAAALAPFEPHPQQGWHVKLTVHADGSQGADTKFKVFWVTGCEEPPPTTTTSTTTTSTTSTTSTTEPPSTTTSAPPPSSSTTSTTYP